MMAIDLTDRGSGMPADDLQPTVEPIVDAGETVVRLVGTTGPVGADSGPPSPRQGIRVRLYSVAAALTALVAVSVYLYQSEFGFERPIAEVPSVPVIARAAPPRAPVQTQATKTVPEVAKAAASVIVTPPKTEFARPVETRVTVLPPPPPAPPPATSSGASSGAPPSALPAPTSVAKFVPPDAAARAAEVRDKPVVVKPPPRPRATVLAAPRMPVRVARTAPVRAATKPAAGGRYGIQLASLRNATAAAREMRRLKRKFRTVLAGHDVGVERATVSGRGTVYRVRARGFARRNAATRACAQIISRKSGCLVFRRR